MFENITLSLLLPLSFIVGCAIGSFVTMASYRLPYRQDIVFKPSYCPLCNATLTIPDLVPLLSWAFQRGRCRHCHASISMRYPLIELSLGVIFTALVYFYGVTVQTFFFLLLATELLILIVTDLEHYIIPDSLQIVLFFTGIAYCIFCRNSDAQDVLMSFLLGLGIGLVLHYGYVYLRHKDALGMGDVKFLAVAGVFLPVEAFVPFLFLAGVIGTITGIIWKMSGLGAIFPFGPALACSLFINVLFFDTIARLMP